MAKKPAMGRNLNSLLGRSKGPAKAPPRTTPPPAADDSAASDVVDGVEVVAEDATLLDKHVSAETSGDERTGSSPSASSNSVQTSNENQSAAGSSAANRSTSVPAGTAAPALANGDRLRMLGVDQITRGSYQPRRHFDKELLQELADSLKAQGLIQPVLVRPWGTKFELIAGERRWRAAQLAGLGDIPAIVREMSDQSVAAVALIENIQRKDLNPLEEAEAFSRLRDEFGMTHDAVAESVGRSRTAVSNILRLLDLADEPKRLLEEGKLDMGHARALLGAPLEDQPEIAKRIVNQQLTVRAVERLIREMRSGKAATNHSSGAAMDPDIRKLQQSLGEKLGARVSIKHKSSGGGKLEIKYSSVDELDGILKHIK